MKKLFHRLSLASNNSKDSHEDKMAPKQIVLAFDAYGTLLSTESIAKQLASHFGEDTARGLAATWRKYQLEYSWRANSMGLNPFNFSLRSLTKYSYAGIYWDFSKLTRRSLIHTLSEAGLSLSDEDIETLMKAYDSLSTFPDVHPMLDKLKDAKNIKRVIFSNGTHSMVSSSVHNSPDLSPYADLFDDVVSVDDIRRYKPAPEAYHHLAEKVGKDIHSREQMAEVFLVSGNPFDVVGGRSVGMNALWVDRAGNGWQDNMMPGTWNGPSEIVSSLDQVVDIAVKVAYQ
jgi:2-haloacid dehalogenase